MRLKDEKIRFIVKVNGDLIAKNSNALTINKHTGLKMYLIEKNLVQEALVSYKLSWSNIIQYAHVCGLRSPYHYKETDFNHITSPVDGYEVHVLANKKGLLSKIMDWLEDFLDDIL